MYRKARAKALVIQNHIDSHRALYGLYSLLCEAGFSCVEHEYCAGVKDSIFYMQGY